MSEMKTDTTAEPNLTPMLDMVFQLITFFMLVINFKAASMDLSLQLPVVGSAVPVDTQGTEDLLVLNVDFEGKLKVYGLQKDVASYIQGEAKASFESAKRENPGFDKKDDLPTTIVIRADKQTPFSLLNVIISTCQKNGFRKFALKAMNKEDG